mgnify:CR=1 FL=1
MTYSKGFRDAHDVGYDTTCPPRAVVVIRVARYTWLIVRVASWSVVRSRWVTPARDRRGPATVSSGALRGTRAAAFQRNPGFFTGANGHARPPRGRQWYRRRFRSSTLQCVARTHEIQLAT